MTNLANCSLKCCQDIQFFFQVNLLALELAIMTIASATLKRTALNTHYWFAFADT
jgi:hypothetical protein